MFTLVPIKARFVLEGVPCAGAAEFEPSQPLRDVSTGDIVSGVRTVLFDAEGYLGAPEGAEIEALDDATTLPAPDPATGLPTAYWRVRLKIQGDRMREYVLYVYVADAGAGVQLATRLDGVAQRPLYPYVLLPVFAAHVAETIAEGAHGGPPNLTDLADYDNTTPPAVGQAPIWDGTAWVPGAAGGTSTIAGATDYDNTPPGTTGQVIVVTDTGFAPGDDTAILVHDPTVTGNPFSWPMTSLRTALSTVYAAIATAISDLGLGTAATHDVPASGNAGPTQAVLGNDTRLGAGPYLDSEALDGTMGDDFAGSSLDGRWTRYGITSGMETYQPAASALITDISIGTAALYTQALPSGDGTYVASLSTTGPNAARMFGLFILDSGGGGRGVAAFTDNHFYGATISAYAYAAFWADLSSMGGYAAVGGVRVWFRLRKTATVIGVAFSLDGTVWSHETTVADSSAWTRIAVGRVYGTGTDDRLIFHRFNRTA